MKWHPWSSYMYIIQEWKNVHRLTLVQQAANLEYYNLLHVLLSEVQYWEHTGTCILLWQGLYVSCEMSSFQIAILVVNFLSFLHVQAVLKNLMTTRLRECKNAHAHDWRRETGNATLVSRVSCTWLTEEKKRDGSQSRWLTTCGLIIYRCWTKRSIIKICQRKPRVLNK